MAGRFIAMIGAIVVTWRLAVIKTQVFSKT
jgi:hypothetical protein